MFVASLIGLMTSGYELELAAGTSAKAYLYE